mgnify:CR=1 FL=1
MGLFDALKKKVTGEIELQSNQEALDILLYAVASIDGEIEDEELGTVIALAHMYKEVAGVDNDIDVEVIAAHLETYGAAQAIHNTFEHLPEALHETAFAYACMVAIADGEISQEEENVLIEVADLTDAISIERASEIISVTSSLMIPVV